MSSKVGKEKAGVPSKRTTHKYSEIDADAEEIDDSVLQDVLGKSTRKGGKMHAFDAISDDTELTEQQVNMLKREARKRKWVRRAQWVSDRIQALFWVSIASLILYKTNFFRELWENELIKGSLFMNLTLLSLGLNMTILCYVTIGLPMKGLEADINLTPKLIPILTASGIFLPLFLTLAIWPVWGMLAPVYIFFLTFGFIFALTFLPGGKCGTILFWVLIVGVATCSHLLPHSGHEHAW